MNKNRNKFGQFERANGTNSWKDINFYEEYLPYYETHTRAETIKYFNISEQQHKSLCKFYNYIKPWRLIHSAANQEVEKDFSEIDFNEFKCYYEAHTREQTLKHFKISLSSLKTLCRTNNYKKPKSLVVNNIINTKLETGSIKYDLKEFLKKVDFWKEYVPFFETHTRGEVLEYFGINRDLHKKLLNLYGYEKSKQLISKCKKHRYFISGKYFDSIPEAAVYIYYTDNNIPIKQEPIVFNYIFNGKTYKYFPDFEIDGKLVEIKGDYFFKSDCTMCNPYNHEEDAKYEAKHQCGLKNNVEFWTSKDYSFAINYCVNKYGENWFKKEETKNGKN